MTTIPYTYIIKHLPTGKFYYGCRWAKNCNPKDLWVSYFTSSDEVKKLITEYGIDSFIYHIHRTFNDTNSCVKFENKYLVKIDAMRNPRFLNKSNGNGYYNGTGKEPANKGKPNLRSKGTKMYNNGFIVGFFKEEDVPEGWIKGKLKQPWNKGKKAKDDYRIELGSKKSGESQKGNKPWNTGLTKEDHPAIKKYAETLAITNAGKPSPAKNRIWYNNGQVNKRLKLDQTIPDGFIKGALKGV